MLDRLEQSWDTGDFSSGNTPGAMAGKGKVEALENQLIREFVNLTTPVIGASAAESLCVTVLDRLKMERSSGYHKIGFIAAFLLDDFDDGSMKLDDHDWDDIRETLEEASIGMRLETLTSLMGELLSRGKLD